MLVLLSSNSHVSHLIYGRDTTTFRGKISSDKWIDHARTAFSVDPRIALSMTLRFPANAALQSETTQLVQVCYSLLWLLLVQVLFVFLLTSCSMSSSYTECVSKLRLLWF